MSKVGKIVLDWLEDNDGEELTSDDIRELNKRVIKELDDGPDEPKTIKLEFTTDELACMLATLRAMKFASNMDKIDSATASDYSKVLNQTIDKLAITLYGSASDWS